MNNKTKRLDKLEENLNQVCCLIRFIQEEEGTSDLRFLCKNSEYCVLLGMQYRLYSEIKSIHKELGGDPLLKNQ